MLQIQEPSQNTTSLHLDLQLTSKFDSSTFFSQVKDQPSTPQRHCILVVEPQQAILDTLRLALVHAGYEVIAVTNEREGIKQFHHHKAIDLVLSELSISGTNGLGLCSEIRRFSSVPIVLLSDLRHIDHLVYGFSLGADDYITKPIYFPILQARMAAILQRCARQHTKSLSGIISANNIILNEELHSVTVCNQLVSLSPTEYLLLRYLMHRRDRPVSKLELFQNVWGYTEPNDINLVRVGVHRLREKIEENPAQPNHVLTVPGIGYKFQTLQPLYQS